MEKWTESDEYALTELAKRKAQVKEINTAELGRLIDEAGNKDFLSSEIEVIRAFLLQVEADDLQAIMTVVWNTPK